MKKIPMQLKMCFLLIIVCFVILILIMVFNYDKVAVGQAFAFNYKGDVNKTTFLSILLLISFAGSLMIVTINNANPHLDHEFISFKVDKPLNKKYLYQYLKFCKLRNRDFSDIKKLLVKNGWDERTIREIADKLNH